MAVTAKGREGNTRRCKAYRHRNPEKYRKYRREYMRRYRSCSHNEEMTSAVDTEANAAVSSGSA
jgi:hypothetical protein